MGSDADGDGVEKDLGHLLLQVKGKECRNQDDERNIRIFLRGNMIWIYGVQNKRGKTHTVFQTAIRGEENPSIKFVFRGSEKDEILHISHNQITIPHCR